MKNGFLTYFFVTIPGFPGLSKSPGDGDVTLVGGFGIYNSWLVISPQLYTKVLTHFWWIMYRHPGKCHYPWVKRLMNSKSKQRANWRRVIISVIPKLLAFLTKRKGIPNEIKLILCICCKLQHSLSDTLFQN